MLSLIVHRCSAVNLESEQSKVYALQAIACGLNKSRRALEIGSPFPPPPLSLRDVTAFFLPSISRLSYNGKGTYSRNSRAGARVGVEANSRTREFKSGRGSSTSVCPTVVVGSRKGYFSNGPAQEVLGR